MRHRPVVVAAVVTAAALSAATVAALGTIDGAASVDAVAERGERVLLEPEPPTARYRVSFVVEWGPATHPSTLPPGSHTSPTVLAVHGEAGDLFSVGSLASPGIERMAEVGSTATLTAELGADPTVSSVDVGRRIDGPGVDAFEVSVDQNARLVSLVSMLAPSPDWFVGVADVELFVDGRWIPSVELTLGAYDAGTDSGPGFTSPNVDTSPAQPISGPRDAAFGVAASEAPFGRILIERLR